MIIGGAAVRPVGRNSCHERQERCDCEDLEHFEGV
jgi:hypothetical protein